MKNTIRFERQNAVGRIVLANPPYNRLDLQFSECLRQAVHDASESDIRVLVVQAEGPHFSFGGEVREWPGKDVNWFRTFVAELNLSYRAIEALRVPTIAAVQGVAFGGGFELALACDFIVAAENAVFRCVEVTTGMLPIAGGLQRLAEHVVREAELAQAVESLVQKLAVGPTKSYAATRTLLKAWSAGGVPAADTVLLDISMDLFNTEDVTRGFLNTAEAIDRDVEPPDMVFNNR